MIYFIKSYSANIPLKRKIFLIVIFNVIIFSIISLIALNIVIDANNKLLHKSMSNTLAYSTKDISKQMETINALSNIMIADKIIQKQLSIIKDSENIIERKNAHDSLYNVMHSYYLQFKQNHISYISLNNDKYAMNTYNFTKNFLSEKTRLHIIERAIKKEGAPIWITDYSKEEGLFFARSIRRIENLKLDTIGVLIICVNPESLVNASTNYNELFGLSSYVLFEKEKLIYHSSDLEEEDISNIQKHSYDPYDIISFKNNRYFGIKTTIPKTDWEYINLISYNLIYNSMEFTYVSYILLVVISAFISTFLSDKLIKSFTVHFDKLILKIKCFGDKDVKVIDVGYDYKNRTDELGLLHTQFDKMTLQITNLINVNYKIELLRKDAELKALESQINPHFLYNTLESINWQAKAVNEKKISIMIESLGNLLRITLNKKKENIVLKEEVELINCYMAIQQIRFEGELSYSLLVSDEILNASIPKLIIQPLVENSIHYALEEMGEKCYIEILIEKIENNLNIYVKNNSSQFEDNLIEKLEKEQVAPRGFGIGLLNIQHRLKLSFGEEYGLHLYNENNLAVAKIVIPYIPKAN